MTGREVLPLLDGYLRDHGYGKSADGSTRASACPRRGKKRLDLYFEFDQSLPIAERAPLRDVFAIAVTGKPLQHFDSVQDEFSDDRLRATAEPFVPVPKRATR